MMRESAGDWARVVPGTAGIASIGQLEPGSAVPGTGMRCDATAGAWRSHDIGGG